jgi:hypothetical protein
MKPIALKRVLALDLRILSFGFVMFEGPHQLLDWGVKSFRHGVNAVKIPIWVKLLTLLDRYGPDVVVLKVPTTTKLSTKLHAIEVLAKSRKIPVKLVSRTSVRGAFPENSKNKDQIAAVIASRDPELLPRLGPKRKAWQAEKYSMSVFDAAAIGIAYFIREPKLFSDLNRQMVVAPE